MEYFNIIIALHGAFEWVISFFKRIRNVCVPKKAVGTERNTEIINITVINPIIINHAKSQILKGQLRGARK